MQVFNIGKKMAIKLMAGDIVLFFVALVLSLTIRNGEVPILYTLLLNIYFFVPVFALWIVGFFIYNLYGRSTVSAKKNLPTTLFQATALNTLTAVIFFYIISVQGVTPKTTLILISIISYLLVYAWRVIIWPRVSHRQNEAVLVVGKTPEHEEIFDELNNNPSMHVVAALYEGKNSEELKAELKRVHAKVVIVDMRGSHAEALFSSFTPEEILKLRFVNPSWLYEELFGRIPLSHVTNTWLFTHVRYEQKVYDAFKRIIDVLISFVVGIMSLVFYPFIILAIKLEDGGKIFIKQVRVGQSGRSIQIIKFRSMTGNDQGKYEGGKSQLHITRVGSFLRASRLDELPQLWNILMGDLSVIGPRPELVPLVEQYTKEIPFYPVRHVIAPGLAGWAQLHQINAATDPHHGTAVEATREKLSYDLYYLKHRSLTLDLMVMLRTVQILLSRPGS
ncbi:MAG: sugar transferase [Candidatus Paceibacterota bacterium]|jgi:lipopolysaccharide/colanic/teichoic acid biosynthesis glycosyltransferase